MVYRNSGAVCPACKEPNDGSLCHSPNVRPPVEGDISICRCCGAISEFDAWGHIRPTTRQHVDQIVTEKIREVFSRATGIRPWVYSPEQSREQSSEP